MPAHEPALSARWHAGSLVLVALLSSACSPRTEISQLQQQLAVIAAQPAGEIEPVPAFAPYEAFTYSAASMRSPFELPHIVAENDSGEPPDMVQPDLTREREPLEDFAISALEMVGMIRQRGRIMALVRDPTGQVHRVMQGSYLGRNHGRVNTIAGERIELTEIVPAGDGGWVERPRTVELSQ